jgi:hypothetical protein
MILTNEREVIKMKVKIVERGSVVYLEYVDSDVVIRDFATVKSAERYAKKYGYEVI